MIAVSDNPSPEFKKGDTVSLTPQQRRRAQELREKVEDGEVTTAQDILETWEGESIDEVLLSNDTETTPTWVSLSRVKGTPPALVDRFVPECILKILDWLLNGKFQPYYQNEGFIPRYIEIGGDIYVHNGGIHRTITCKAVGVEQIYARLTTLRLKNEQTSESG